MANIAPGTARGMRDLLPADMRRQLYVCGVLTEVFEAFGFEPLSTPAIERAETLLGKYGPDAERLIYRASLGREQSLALRYDHTVSTARVAATYDALPRPFKRYQIGPVWRGERPQRGRFREFTQADVDIIGEASVLADAEIVAIVITALDRLGFPASLTKLNNRKLLNGIGRFAGVPDGQLAGLYRAIDKLDKIGMDGVRRELRSVGLPGDLLNRERQAVDRWLRGTADRARLREDLGLAQDAAGAPIGANPGIEAFLDALADFPEGAGTTPALLERASAVALDASIAVLRQLAPRDDLVPDGVTERLLELLQLSGAPRPLLDALGARLDDPGAREGIAELVRVMDALDAAGIDPERYAVDFAMVRGLDYYTGTIFETLVEEPPIGSITGGGRYDTLIGLFGTDLPAVGSSFGIDRLVDVMDTLDLFPASLAQPTTRVLVALFDDATAMASVEAASRLRRAGIPTELAFRAEGIGEQIRTALKREIPVLVILGPDEIAAGQATLRDLRRRVQRSVPLDDLVEVTQAILSEAE
ncbi:MAG: histidine--tRNA ligase [Caldilineae bacterium]|nr:histidine--tRNA ligase [Caldilineae bacterium]